MKNKLTLCVIVVTVLVLFISACSSTQPTVDPNIVYTEAAKTVAAELTKEVPPTAPPTATPPPTNTPVPPTNTPTTEPPTETPQPTATGENAAASTPTPTLRAGSDELVDEALFTVYYPPVDQRYTSGGVFNAQVGFQNVGPNTWNSGYSMRFLSGNDFGVGGKYTLDEFGSVTTVAPGEEVVITIPYMTAPQEEGTYISNWCFYNNREDQGLRPQCFFLVSFQIIVRND